MNLRKIVLFTGLGVAGTMGINGALSDKVELRLIEPDEPKLEMTYNRVEIPYNVDGIEAAICFIEPHYAIAKGK